MSLERKTVGQDGYEGLPISRRALIAGTIAGVAGWTLLQDQVTLAARSESQTESERINRLLAIDIMREYVDFSSNPFTQELHKRVSENPEEHIEIVGPLGAPGFYIPDNYSFFIYPERKNQRGPNDFRDWSILIGVEDSANDALDTIVSIQLNASGHVFRGPGDIIARPGGLSITAKALQADYLFNIPDAMQLAQWYAQDVSQTSYQRQYIDSNGSMLTQVVGPANVISLSASYSTR